MEPKLKTWRSKEYLQFVRSQSCAVCFGRVDVQAHHWRLGTDGGTGLKPSDCYTIPLCADHHIGNNGVHHTSEKRFAETHNLDIPGLWAALIGAWIAKTADKEMIKRIAEAI